MKKILPLILIAALLCSAVMLISCGTTPEENTPASSDTETTASSTDASASTHGTEATTSASTEKTTETTSATTATTTMAKPAEPVIAGKISLKILAVGNSFSEDALQYLYDMAKEAGYTDIVLANARIGGCSLATHFDNAEKNRAAYEFFLNTDGKWTSQKSFTLAKALSYTDWDCISLQQASGYSGMESSYEPYLTSLIKYVKDACPEAKLVWHATWAYQGNSYHNDFARYGKNQMTMYNAINAAVENAVLAAHGDDFSAVIPSGTAIQNLRTSFLGDNLTRDTYHLSYDAGRYTAALTWLKVITGADLSKITYIPYNYGYAIGERAAAAAKEAAENAVASPFAVTQSSYSAASYESRKEEDLKKLGLDPEKYTAPELDFIPYSYYNSVSGMKLTSKAGGSQAGNINKFAASRMFAKADIPVGSVIILEKGYTYRPEGWRALDYKNSDKTRPAEISDETVTVTADWWGRFIYRAFNISKSDKSDFTESEIASLSEILRIYIPQK